MTIVKPITIQIAAPSCALPGGAVSTAYYVADKNQVTLTDRDGNTLHDPEGRDYSQKLAESDNPHQVAALLLRRFRTKVRGDRVAGFDGPIRYPRWKAV